MPGAGRYSDQDVEHYDRPRRHTRPRTKDRPSFDDAVDGVVITLEPGRFTRLVDGTTRVVGVTAGPGQTVLATVVGTEGIDLVADPT